MAAASSSSSSSGQVPPTLFDEIMAKKEASKAKAKARGRSAKAKAKAGEGSSRHLARRSTEDAAERSIAEHWPNSSLHWRMNARDDKGVKLIDVVVEAKRATKRGTGRLGSLFWDGLRKKYICDGSGGNIDDAVKKMPVDAKLRDAATKCLEKDTNSRTRAPLLAWLRKCKSCNERELECLCRLLHKLRPGSQPGALTCVLETMKLVMRLGLADKFRRIISDHGPLWDKCLVLSLSRLPGVDEFETTNGSRHGRDPSLWCWTFRLLNEYGVRRRSGGKLPRMSRH